MHLSVLYLSTLFVVAHSTDWTLENCIDLFSQEHHFCTYIKVHGKNYSNDNWVEKFHIIEDAVDYIAAHNTGLSGYTLKLSPVSDVSHRQFVDSKLSSFTRLRPHHSRRLLRLTSNERHKLIHSKIPKSFDWRDTTYMTPVNSQGPCGSCFAIVGPEILDWWNNKLQPDNKNTSSVQQLLDCSSDEFPDDAERCAGSVMEYPLRYASHHRVWTERDYPYEETGDTCRGNVPSYKTIHPTQMHHTGLEEEADIRKNLPFYLYHFGPVGVSFDASDPHFQHLGGGVYSPRARSCSRDFVNHAMLVVGYTPTYYIIKNSWGDQFADNGYFKLKRGVHMCGMHTVVSVVADAILK